MDGDAHALLGMPAMGLGNTRGGARGDPPMDGSTGACSPRSDTACSSMRYSSCLFAIFFPAGSCCAQNIAPEFFGASNPYIARCFLSRKGGRGEIKA